MEALRLWLDSYYDLYSDFDSRHFGRRRISEDFMHELRLFTDRKVLRKEMLLFKSLAGMKIQFQTDNSEE